MKLSIKQQKTKIFLEGLVFGLAIGMGICFIIYSYFKQ